MGVPNRQIGEPSSTENTLLHNILKQIVRLTEVISTSGGGGVTTFIQLTDVPNSYSGQAGKGVRVNAGATALEFFTLGGGTGTVTSVSVVSTNGFAGTVATATTTPAITITTTITGVLKGNGTAISAATVGTDYSVGTSALATGILKSTTITGALSIASAGTDYLAPGGSGAALTGVYLLASGGTATGTNTLAMGSNPFIMTTSVTTGTGATSGFQMVANSLTTGNALDQSSSSNT